MRKKYIRVEEINLIRLANAEFMNFMERFLSLLPLEAEGEPESGEMGAPKLSITAEQVTEAKGYLAQMNDLTRIPQMKAETKPKEEVDRKRDSLISLLFSRVKTSRSVPIEAESKAAEQLYIVISPYRGIGKLPYNQETEMIKGLLLDLRKLENSEAVRTLGLDAYVDELDNCNKQFEALVKTADMKNSELGFNEQMRDLRVAMTDLYREMTDYAFATNLLNETEESLYFMSGLNALIHDVESIYKQRLNSRKKKEEEKPAGEGSDSGLEFVPVDKN
ncbi:putative uncharacterized protein [Parabacteroides sp. CAG:409]|nr:putative uncharacterized protein [Parabacteroides sp. CAG:409]